MAAPSYHLTSYTGTTDPAGDIITLAEIDLTAAGWTFVEQASFTQGGTPRYLRVWKCPSTLNRAGVDFFVGLVKNQAAGIYLAARAFEGYNATNHTIQRPCVAGSSAVTPWNTNWTTKTLALNLISLGNTYLGGLFLLGTSAAGTQIQTSPDALAWTARTMPSSSVWRAFAYGNGTWIAIASATTAAAYSSNGSTWTASVMPSSAGWQSCAFGNNIFVALGGTGGTSNAAASSPDGITWTARTLPATTSWGPVVFANGVFVCISKTSATAIAATSTDGINWTARTLPSNQSSWNGLAYGNGVFVATSNGSTVCATSPDGVTWTQRTTPAAYDQITFGNGLFVASTGGGTAVASSPDGINWTVRPGIGATTGGLSYGNGLFLSVLSSTSSTGSVTPMDTTAPSHGGVYDFSLDNPVTNYPPQAELLPTAVLAAATNYDVGVLVSKSYLVINVQNLGTATMRLTWLLGLFDPVYADSQATYPPLVAVDLREFNPPVGVSGVSRTPRVAVGPYAFGVVAFPESVTFGVFPGAVAEPASGAIRAARVALGGTGGIPGLGFTGAGGCYRGRLYDAIAVNSNNTATAIKVGDSVTIGGTVYTALGSSGTSQPIMVGTHGYFFNTAAGS